MHEFDMPALDTEARETAILAQSSEAELRDKGLALFAARRYDAAARRFGALHKRNPDNAEVTIRLGLALWFSGHPAQAQKLWQTFSAPDNPELEQRLTQRASALRILSYRLGARRILEDHRRGELMPAIAGSAVILPAALPEHPREARPGMNTGLHFLLLDALSDEHTLQPAPRGLTSALRAESGSDLSATLDETLKLARILGADHAVTVSATIPDDHPGVLRTTLSAQITESLQGRTKRLANERNRAENAWATAESQLRHLEEQQERCAEILTYFNATHRLSSLLVRRDQLAEAVARMNREGHAEQAIKAMQRHRETVAEMTELQTRIKDFERRLVLGMEGVRRFTPEAFRQKSEQLALQQQALEKRLPELRKAAWAAVARASTPWPAQGRSVTFDIALSDINTWPARAVERLAHLVGEPTPPLLPPRDWGLTEFQRLNNGLMAWDNGEYSIASRLFALAGQACKASPQYPGQGFDVLRLSDLPPESVAAFFLNDFDLDSGGKHD
ncbi:tetratricopeptide repeat protein [Desulfovibrio ferrophilus]|uniref:Tetratricopeptide repeat protein n=1 Tax=Desulfovibrio ferrophilus TaxID=241368 RepID=A0A2Z6AUD2_9BACT|nr:tetratricopeptide repeat protein [Desulfovibrio ferrophilus]BBD06841.1 tetratricopeptide repeat protein [Desulfovibrio ferrophilus]